LPAAQALTVGQKLDLNQASADELQAIPGLGGQAARALVAERTRRGNFQSWEDVDAVPGIGPGRLRLLQKVSELRGFDAGAW
jgi:competence protein ComEA